MRATPARGWDKAAAIPIALGIAVCVARAQEPLLSELRHVDPQALAWAEAQRQADPAILDTTFVSLDQPLGTAVDLNGQRYELELVRGEQQLDFSIYRGSIGGQENGVTLAVRPDGVTAGQLELADERYVLAYTGIDRVHALHRHDPTAHPHAICGIEPAEPLDHEPSTATTPDGTATVIDVCVFYTPAAATGAGGTVAMESRIAFGMGLANTAALNSQVDHVLRLVHVAETNYTETSLNTDLNRFRINGDGFMDEVHPLRNQFGGDLMVLVTGTSAGGICSTSNQLCSANPAFEALAFCAVVSNCIPGHSMTHALGHLMGCGHDNPGAGCLPFPYSRGYNGPNGRSIMASSPGLIRNYWSNPNVLVAGAPFGTANQDNARSLNNLNGFLATLRPTQVGTDPPVLSSIAPLSAPSYPGGQFTLTGSDLLNVGMVTVGGNAATLISRSSGQVTFSLPAGFEIATHQVTVTSAGGTSNPVSLDIVGNHPAVLPNPTGHARGTQISYTSWTDRDWFVTYWISDSFTPSTLPGIAQFEIGAGFTRLFLLATVQADGGGRADLPLTMPATAPVGANIYFEVLVYPPTGPVAPLETSQGICVTIL